MTRTPCVIAIDGPSGSGKSTVSRGVAAALGLPVLDTGAMYRAVTLAALERAVPLDDELACGALAQGLRIDVEDGATTLDGRDVSAEIQRLSARFPPGLKVEVAFDTTSVVSESIAGRKLGGFFLSCGAPRCCTLG